MQKVLKSSFTIQIDRIFIIVIIIIIQYSVFYYKENGIIYGK